MTVPHHSVLLQEVLNAFETLNISMFVDGTLGAGGHSAALLEAHPEIEHFLGIDQDPTALAIAKERLAPWSEKVHFFRGNFGELGEALSEHQMSKVNGILLDIGVSSMQFDQPEKGFSFLHEGPLDMRMDPEGPLTAEEVVNSWSEAELGRVFREYGEERRWRKAAYAIVKVRAERPIKTTLQLGAILDPVLRVWPQKKGIHPLTLVFQALRICVNGELEVLEKVLPQAIDALAPGGRLAVITFHSLEDRIVKRAFRFAASDKEQTTGLGGLFLDKEPTVDLVTRKPISPSTEEVATNPRARSAKLRVVEKR